MRGRLGLVAEPPLAVYDRVEGGGTLVNSAGQGRPLVLDVRNLLARFGLSLSGVRVPFRLVDGPQDHARGGARRWTRGWAETAVLTNGVSEIDRQVVGVSIVRGLPKEEFCAVSAHELGHVWLFLKRFPSLDPRLEEGLCELFSYMWLRTSEAPLARLLADGMEWRRDSVYSRGFLMVREAARRTPLDELLLHIRRTGRLP